MRLVLLLLFVGALTGVVLDRTLVTLRPQLTEYAPERNATERSQITSQGDVERTETGGQAAASARSTPAPDSDSGSDPTEQADNRETSERDAIRDAEQLAELRRSIQVKRNEVDGLKTQLSNTGGTDPADRVAAQMRQQQQTATFEQQAQRLRQQLGIQRNLVQGIRDQLAFTVAPESTSLMEGLRDRLARAERRLGELNNQYNELVQDHQGQAASNIDRLTAESRAEQSRRQQLQSQMAASESELRQLEAIQNSINEQQQARGGTEQ